MVSLLCLYKYTLHSYYITLLYLSHCTVWHWLHQSASRHVVMVQFVCWLGCLISILAATLCFGRPGWFRCWRCKYTQSDLSFRIDIFSFFWHRSSWHCVVGHSVQQATVSFTCAFWGLISSYIYRFSIGLFLKVLESMYLDYQQIIILTKSKRIINTFVGFVCIS